MRYDSHRSLSHRLVLILAAIVVAGVTLASDVKPSRLGAAQEAVRTFLKRVPKRVRVGLIAFSSEPQIAA